MARPCKRTCAYRKRCVYMATCGAAGSSGSAVCCPVCYREYSDSDSDLVPRILHCGHSYCTECLRRLLDVEEDHESDNGLTDDMFGYVGDDIRSIAINRWGGRRFHSVTDQVTCPVCKNTNHVLGGEVENLTKNFALLGMLDGVEKTSQHYCQEHEHEQRIYCQECQQLVCAYCQLYGRHKTHQCLIATEACEPAVQALRELHTEMKGQLTELEISEAAVLESVQKLERSRERSERKIHYYFGKLIHALEQKQEAEVERVQTWSDEQACILQAQLRSVSAARKTCSRLLDDCRRVTECDPLQALYEQEPLSHRGEEVISAWKSLPHEPIITPTIYTEQISDSTSPLQSLITGLEVTMTLDPTEEHEDNDVEESTTNSELVGSLLHAQDTQHTSSVLPKLDSDFAVDPSPSLASPSTPASYSNTPRYSAGATTTSHYSTQHNGQSPTSSNSDNSDPATGDEFKDLRLRHPLSFLMGPRLWPYHQHNMLRHTLSHDFDEAPELADDGSDDHHPSPPSPPSTISISPLTHSQATSEDRVSVSIAGGQGLHISVSGSTWPHTMVYPPSLLLQDRDTLNIDDSD